MTIRRRALVARSLLRSRAPSPLGALGRGLIAGAIGAGVQSLFFFATAKLAPKLTKVPPQESKPEAAAQGETSLQTVSRRLVDGMMQRGPISVERKSKVASLLHYAFGAIWGGLYGLLRESAPSVPPPVFGLGVWAASDNLILPAFRVAGWPQNYSKREHAYAVQAHLVYGFATAGAYALLRDLPSVPLAALPAVLLLQARSFFRSTPPGRLLNRNRSLPWRWGNALVQRTALA